jgi:hypothetical protein
MLNRIESYEEAGRKEAQARNDRDEARARHWGEFFSKMMANEKPQDRIAAKQAYTTAYSENRSVARL